MYKKPFAVTAAKPARNRGRDVAFHGPNMPEAGSVALNDCSDSWLSAAGSDIPALVDGQMSSDMNNAASMIHPLYLWRLFLIGASQRRLRRDWGRHTASSHVLPLHCCARHHRAADRVIIALKSLMCYGRSGYWILRWRYHDAMPKRHAFDIIDRAHAVEEFEGGEISPKLAIVAHDGGHTAVVSQRRRFIGATASLQTPAGWRPRNS
jgi:hypothetical protein